MATGIHPGYTAACLGEVQHRHYECIGGKVTAGVSRAGLPGRGSRKKRYCVCQNVQKNASLLRRRWTGGIGSERAKGEGEGGGGGKGGGKGERERVVVMGGACGGSKVIALVGRSGRRSTGIATWLLHKLDRYDATHVDANLLRTRWGYKGQLRKKHLQVGIGIHRDHCAAGSARGGSVSALRGQVRHQGVGLPHGDPAQLRPWLVDFRFELHRGTRRLGSCRTTTSTTNRFDRLRARASLPEDEVSGSESTRTSTIWYSEQGEEEDDNRPAADFMVDGISFGQLCNNFVCISSPAVEATARQLARDIADLKEGSRKTLLFAVSVKYKDPLRSFQGREKYRRMNFFSTALDNPSVALEGMEMLSTGTLMIEWKVTGAPKLPPASVVGGVVVLRVKSTFQLNQITGQVTDHEEKWDLTGSSPLAISYFYATRLAFSSVEAGNDLSTSAAAAWKNINKPEEPPEPIYYSDPNDPQKFFQMDDTSTTDLFQLGFAIALLYLLVQFLRLVL